MKVLIIEDEEKISEWLSNTFEESGFVVKTVDNGEEGHFEGEEGGYDAIVLDLGLPDMDGITMLEKWRSNGIDTPVIILTARDTTNDVLRGLEAGADDYVVKGVTIDEVVARVNTHIKRSKGHVKKELKCGDITFDLHARKIYKDMAVVKLTRIQFLILQYLFLNQSATISITELEAHIYADTDFKTSVIPKHIFNIRKKLGDGIIITDTDRGYYVPKDE